MSEFLDALKSASDSPQVKINEFLSRFNPKSNKIGIFLEGRDDPSLIRVQATTKAAELNLSVDITILGKKKDVIKAWKFLDPRYPNHPKLMFFVDKDHDDLIGEVEGIKTKDGLFVTPHYSIENFLVSENAISIFLIDIWGLDSSSSAIEIACKKFKSFQRNYRNAFLPWMAWIIAVRRLGGSPQNNNVKFSILSINYKYEPVLNCQPDIFTYLADKCKVSNPPTPETIDSVKEELEKLPTKQWLRGKQEIWCFIAFLNKLEQDIKSDKSIKPPRINSPINPNNAVEILAPRLPCPEELKEFLQSRLSKL